MEPLSLRVNPRKPVAQYCRHARGRIGLPRLLRQRFGVRFLADFLAIVRRIEPGPMAAPRGLMARFTSRSRSEGTRSVPTWPIPIITCRLISSMPSGGNVFLANRFHRPAAIAFAGVFLNRTIR